MMSKNNKFECSDIYSVEFQLQEKLFELQWKTKALEDAQKEVLTARKKLYDNQMQLEDEKRTLADVRMQLRAAQQVIDWMEKDKAKSRKEKIEMQINSETALRERESLIEQARAAKVENITLKLQVQKLDEEVAAKEKKNTMLDKSMTEFKEQTTQINNILKRNITKLEKEQEYLRKTIESATELNKRLQAAGLCSHAVYQKKNAEIERLQSQLTQLTNKDTVATAVECIVHEKNSKELKMSSKKAITETDDINSQLEAIFKELAEA